jgi:hypothetical protein
VDDDSSPDQYCWHCGAQPQAFRFACPECARRWEEMECRQLRERLFGLSLNPPIPAAPRVIGGSRLRTSPEHRVS